MPIVAEVQIPIATQDPREAVRKCFSLIEAKASLAWLKIGLRLTCGRNREVLNRLSERLPSTVRGFRNTVSGPALTADQLRVLPTSNFNTFDGTLTDHIDPSSALLLIEELLAGSPLAIHRTAFSLEVDNIHWNGAPSDSAGALILSDLKAFSRAKRFSLSATIQLPGNNSAAPEVISILEQVAQATGIAFDQGWVTRVLGESSPELAKAELVGQIYFDEAVESVAARLPENFLSEFALNALCRLEARTQKAVRRGSPGKVDLASVIKSSVKELVPELEFESENGRILFRKHFSLASEIVVAFNKPTRRQAFSLSLGIRSAENGLVFFANVFEFERTGRKIWIYNDITHAREVVREAVGLAKGLLPRFESSIRSHFEVWPGELPHGIERHGNLTARQAFEKAQTVARNQWPDATLIQILNHPRSPKTKQIEGPDLSIDGRLTNNAEWRCFFYSAQGDVMFEMAVPYFGSVRVLSLSDGLNPRRFAPVGEGWMDSDQALALAEDRGGRERRDAGGVVDIATSLQVSAQKRPFWRIRYGVNDEGGRNDLMILFDAVTGEVFDTAVPWRTDLEEF